MRVPLHGLGLLVASLPRSWELALGRALGRAMLRADPKRRRIARDNIRRCLPELGPGGWDALLRANYEHYGILVLEIAHMFTPIPGHFRAYAARTTRIEGLENWRRAHDKGKGVLLFSGHFANWELMIAKGTMAGIPLLGVAHALKPAWLHRWMEKTRASAGTRMTYQPRTLPAVLKTLKGGGTVGFVMDQYMPPPMGAPLRFFGVTVESPAAVAPLARRTGAAVVPARAVRTPNGTLRVIIEPELLLTGDDGVDNQRLADIVEGWVRAEPAQWLWVHRRFKNVDWTSVDRRTQAA